MAKQTKYFGESCQYFPEEKEEAQQYLRSWKKFHLRRLATACYEIKLIDEQWVHREAHIVSSLTQRASMALKIEVEADFYYDLEKTR